MNGPTPESIKEHLFNNAAWFTAVVVAVVYSISWFITYLVTLRLGVGAITPRREQVMSSGILLILYLVPLASYYYRKNIIKTRPHFLRIGKRSFNFYWLDFGACVGYLFSLSVIALYNPYLFGGYFLYVFIVIAFCVAIAFAIGDFLRGDEYGIYMLVAMISLYATSAAPYAKPQFGGFILQRVNVLTSNSALSGKRLLVAEDSTSFVLAANVPFEHFWRAYRSNDLSSVHVVRVPRDSVQLIQAESNINLVTAK